MTVQTLEPTLPKSPKLKTKQDLDTALSEYAALTHHEQQLSAELKQQVEQLKSEHAQRCRVEIGGNEFEYDERRTILVEAIEKYVSANREELLPEKAKSVKLAHATIGWRASAARIGYVKGYDKRKVDQAAENKWGIMKLLMPLIKGARLKFSKIVGAKSFALLELFDVTTSLNLTKAKQLYSEDRCSSKDLNAIGLKFIGSQDTFFVKPHEQPGS